GANRTGFRARPRADCGGATAVALLPDGRRSAVGGGGDRGRRRDALHEPSRLRRPGADRRRRRGGGGDGGALHAVAGREQGRRASAHSAAAAGATAGATERTEAPVQKGGPRRERKLSDSSSPRTFDAVRPAAYSGSMTTPTLYERLGGVYFI